MVNLKLIPTSELKADLEETIVDIRVCELAILGGVTTYSGGEIQERLDVNHRIANLITCELLQRRTEGADNA